MKALAIAMLVACGSPPANRPEPAPPVAPVAPAPSVPPFARRCLPVVAKECHCVYTCGVGEARGDHWMVRHAFWKDSELEARTEQWCVGDTCTEAFAAKIVCDAICAPKPADATCHFDATGACVGAPE
jgi:hypothetical protein